jgi:hypothetical protein
MAGSSFKRHTSAPVVTRRRLWRALVAATSAAITIAGCATPSGRTAGLPKVPSRTSTLPAPCTLLTPSEMLPLFGTKHVDIQATRGPAPGTAQCGYTRIVHSGMDLLRVWTRNDYASDLSYVFPSYGRMVPGIGDVAVLTPTQQHAGTMTIMLGNNVIEMDVNSISQRNDDALLIHLAKDAVRRAERLHVRALQARCGICASALRRCEIQQ